MAPDWAALLAVPAFGVDTLAVSAGMGLTGARLPWRLVATFALFEGTMPVVGALAGAALGARLARAGVLLGAALLAALGVKELVEAWREGSQAEGKGADGDGPAAARGAPESLPALAAAGLSVSLDELAGGFAVGAGGLPLSLLLPAFALQAALFTWLGMAAGARLRRLVGRYGEFAAGAAFLAVAGALATGLL
ncbi:MAG: manganese efflux pump [Firmicutes bacterium]|nr:manganese efflux pump [Bacillota bacterium]